jgi:peptide-methionine (S)-S-oxide reductase
MKERMRNFLSLNPKTKKIIGAVLVFVGLLALITPLTPGSWLIFVGLELLGIDLLLWDRIKKWFGKKSMVKQKQGADEAAIFGGGCFWCTEAVFKILRGVSSVLPGYSGGSTKNPTYAEVSGEKTGHAEVVKIEYNPKEVSYRDLLTVLFASHDPTTMNRQGNDVGVEYRSVIFYTTQEQKSEAEKFIQELNASSEYGKPIVTALEPFTVFYEAENYHKDYFESHPGNPYCELVINPKLEKVQKQFAQLLKTKAGQN